MQCSYQQHPQPPPRSLHLLLRPSVRSLRVQLSSCSRYRLILSTPPEIALYTPKPPTNHRGIKLKAANLDQTDCRRINYAFLPVSLSSQWDKRSCYGLLPLAVGAKKESIKAVATTTQEAVSVFVCVCLSSERTSAHCHLGTIQSKIKSTGML